MQNMFSGCIKLPALEELLKPERIKIVDHANKDEILNMMTGLLANTHELPIAQEKLLEAILAREKLMSTGIGLGLAFPHVRIAEAREIAAAAVLVRSGVSDYETLDLQPVRFVIMIVAPEGQHAQHLRLLAQFSSRLKDKNLSEKIFTAKDANILRELLIAK